MSSRLAGAILALTAAALLALSLVALSWWNGHPVFDGKEIEAKTIYVGPLGAQGCNTGGDGSCKSLEMAGSFTAPAYAALGGTGLLALAAIVLGIATLLSAEGRKTIAKGVLGLAAVNALILALMFVTGPHLAGSHEVAMHVGAGIYCVVAALAAAVFGSVLAKRPLPKPELRPSRASIAPALGAPPPAGAQPVDVLSLLQEDALRPSRPAVAPQPGSSLPGPAGPLGPPPAPLFNSAPQLRPLYDADPAQGGTAGYVPGSPPKLPTRGPTPLPQAAVHAVMGLPTPPPFNAPMVPSHAMVEGRTKPASVPPPPAPPPPLRNPTTQGAAAPPPPGMSPPLPRTRAGTSPPPPGAIAARLKASSVPPPVRANAPSIPSLPQPGGPRTLAAAVAPPPPAAPVLPKQLPIRAATDPSDHAETIDRDAMTLDRARSPDVSIGRPATGEEIGDTTDTSVPIDPAPPADTEQGPAVARPSTDTDDIETSAVEKVEPPRAQSQAETAAVEKVEKVEKVEAEVASKPAAATKRPFRGARSSRPKIEAARGSTTDVELLRPPPSRSDLETGDSTAETDPPEAAATAPAPAAPKIPITTAPESLPPPTEKQAATSGPSPACPQCESPMAWVEEHLRFYCKSCRMYF